MYFAYFWTLRVNSPHENNVFFLIFTKWLKDYGLVKYSMSTS